MYLHECYLVPMPALNAVVEYLKTKPYNEVADLLKSLDGLPNGFSEALLKAGVTVAAEDAEAMLEVAGANIPPEATSLPTPGETVVDFPAGVGRRE